MGQLDEDAFHRAAAQREEILSLREQLAELRLQYADVLIGRASQGARSPEGRAEEERISPPRTATTNGRPAVPKTSKRKPLADPTPLSDGKTPKYEAWETNMKAKLRKDSEDFPTIRDKLDYIFSRTAGKASDLLLPRLADGVAKVKTVDKMFQVLSDQFKDHFLKDKSAQHSVVYA